MNVNFEVCLEEVKNIMREKDELHPNDPAINRCWERLSEILTKNIDTTIEILNSCDQEELESLEDVFEDISRELKSEKFLSFLKELQEKYSNNSLNAEIAYAEKMVGS